jgi:hypothetical protein
MMLENPELDHHHDLESSLMTGWPKALNTALGQTNDALNNYEPIICY